MSSSSPRLEDRSITTLRRMLGTAVRAVGADSVSAQILRRAIANKRRATNQSQEARRAK